MASKQKKLDKVLASGKTPGGSVALSSGGVRSKRETLVQYFEDAKTELGKVSWPTRKEVKITSFAVLALVVVMSLLLGLMDLLLAKIVASILSMGL